MMMKLGLLGLTVILMSACGARVVRIPSSESAQAMIGTSHGEDSSDAVQSPVGDTSKSASKTSSTSNPSGTDSPIESEVPAEESKKPSETFSSDESSDAELPESLPDPGADSDGVAEILPLPGDMPTGGAPEASVYDLDKVVVVESPGEVQSGPASVVIDAPLGSRTQYSLDRDFPVEGGLSLEWTSLSNGQHELEVTVTLPDGQTKDFNFEWRQESGAAAQAKKRKKGHSGKHEDQGQHLGQEKKK